MLRSNATTIGVCSVRECGREAPIHRMVITPLPPTSMYCHPCWLGLYRAGHSEPVSRVSVSASLLAALIDKASVIDAEYNDGVGAML